MQNNNQNTNQDDEVAMALDQWLRSFDISGINFIRFHENDGKSFQISLDSIKRIACFIQEKAGKTTFTAGELTEEKDFLLKNYKSRLSEKDYDLFVTYLSSWVEKGGSFEIVYVAE